MALDTGIYNALMRPPKSALDYQQEYEQSDLNREQTAQTRQINALSLQQHQMTMAEAQRAQGEQTTLRNALASSGATDMQGRIKAAEGTGTLSGIKQADEWRKAQAEQVQKTADARSKNATAEKSEYDLKRTRLEHGIASLTSSPTAAHARAAIAAGVQDGTLNPDQAQRSLAEIPDDPVQYQQWRQAKLMGVLSAKDSLEAQAPKLQEIRQGDRTALVDVKPTSATYGKEKYSAPINASPDALVLAGTQRGGQIIADARERELSAAKAGGAPKLTEDQAKATGWLVQAGNAWDNMKKVAFSPDGSLSSAAKPGLLDDAGFVPDALKNSTRTADRQKFIQGASSLSEALLRAATGAGVNEQEAKQKIAELTPKFGDKPELIKQKMEAIPLYIESLKARAGQGAGIAEGVMSTKGGAAAKPVSAPPARQVNVGGQNMEARRAPDGKYYVKLPSGKYAEVQ